MLIGDILAHTAGRLPEKIAIQAGHRRQTYGDLDRAANRIGNALAAAGYDQSRNIAIFSANHFEYPAIFFGAAKGGQVLAHLSARFSPDELVYVADKTDIELVFVHEALIETILQVRGRLPKLQRIVVFGMNADQYASGTVETLNDFIGGAPDTPPAGRISPDDPFAITFTGGTTGLPKGVVVNHASRVIGSVRARREMAFLEDDKLCCSTPLFHIAGLFVWFQTGIMIGCTCYLMTHWDPAEFIEGVEAGDITAAFMVPTQITSILSHPAFSAEKLAGLRYVNFGGAPMAVAQLKRGMAALPHAIWQEQYGQSEAGNLTVRPPEFNEAKAASVGRAYQDVELAIFDRDGNPLPAGERGEVVTRGPQVMMGYYKDPDQTAEVMFGEWIRTGDVGYLDGDGFLYLVDRSKEMIISGGENLYPTEIEDVLYQHAAVKECAVFGIPDDHWGEVPAAHVVLEDGEKLDEAELIEFALQKLARHKRPRHIRFVEALPKTAVGKIQKTAIRAEYWEGRDRNI